MSGIYMHIPFCKQACHYCDFHFSTSMKKRPEMIAALQKELELRKDEQPEEVQTIYFGGGTPSVLETQEIEDLVQTVYDHFPVAQNPEITLEANPDDLSPEKLDQLAASSINRLSIGVQSFFDQDLKLMNRAHDAPMALRSLQLSRKLFDNISIDLIYGMPAMSDERWRANLKQAVDLDIPHISSYALTVEPNTALHRFVQKEVVIMPEEELVLTHFNSLQELMAHSGYTHYELSNFGKPGFHSKNNSAYWQGKSYLGIGPSAHSFDGARRSWNINNNTKYLKALAADTLAREVETLTMTDRYNEYIMTGLRTIWGVDLALIEQKFGKTYREYALQQAHKHLEEHLMFLENDTLFVSKKGKFLSDGLAADLFLINLKDKA
ncbi:radical SAM family heme chaperone HemW [Croceiramulus getboli]|nr:radical SAM family heme chaperone HemW [Flavobacteriaceae bacterium YJPT1-3]